MLSEHNHWRWVLWLHWHHPHHVAPRATGRGTGTAPAWPIVEIDPASWISFLPSPLPSPLVLRLGRLGSARLGSARGAVGTAARFLRPPLLLFFPLRRPWHIFSLLRLFRFLDIFIMATILFFLFVIPCLLLLFSAASFLFVKF